MTLTVNEISKDELLSIVDERREQVRNFIDWAGRHENDSWSMYLSNRPDIRDARQAAVLYPDPWWGVVVFTCFGSLHSTRAVRNILARPVQPGMAEQLLAPIHFSPPKVGHHRIQ